jgi:hypothetical protein
VALISQVEAAKLIGCDPSKINKWCKDKLLEMHYLPGKLRGLVESDDVLRLKPQLELGAKFTPAAKMKPIEPADSNAPTHSPPRVPVNKKKIADLTEDDFDLFNSQGKLDAVQCRAWGEFEKSRKLNIERLALEGEYVLASEVGPRFERAMLTIQKGVLATRNRLEALHPGLPRPVLDSLDRLLREALEKAVDDSINAN